jgi:hypothetical protein
MIRRVRTGETFVITNVTLDIFGVIIIIIGWTVTIWGRNTISSTMSTSFDGSRTFKTSIPTFFTNLIFSGQDFSVSRDTWTELTTSVWFTIETFVHVTNKTMWEFGSTMLTFWVESIIEVTFWTDVTEWSTFSDINTFNTVRSVFFTS